MNNRGKPLGRDAEVLGSFLAGCRNGLLAGIVGLVLLLAGPLRAADVDARYLEIYGLIEQADALNAKGPAPEAKVKYQAAEKALKELKQTYPTWNVKLVASRLNYLAGKVAAFSPPAPAAAGETKPAAAATRAVLPGQPQVRLLAAGTDPQQLLRFHPQPGAKQKLALVMKMSMGLELGQAPAQEMKVPDITMNMEVEIKSVSAEGDSVYSVAYGDVAVEETAAVAPEMAQAMRAALGNLKGLSATGTNTSRGFNKGMQVNLAPDADPQMRQVLSQMTDAMASIASSLPEEAVGVGAKWETKMAIKSQGMTVNQTMVTELVNLDGDQFTAKISLTQQAANQKVSNPAMPGLKMDLTKLTGSGQGESRFDLAQLLPTQATLASRTEISMGLNSGQQKQAMRMKMDAHITLTTK